MMNYLNKQLAALLMESYDKGVADTRAATAEAIEKAIDAAITAEREACAKIAQAWDVAYPDTNYGRCIANEIRSRK